MEGVYSVSAVRIETISPETIDAFLAYLSEKGRGEGKFHRPLPDRLHGKLRQFLNPHTRTAERLDQQIM